MKKIVLSFYLFGCVVVHSQCLTSLDSGYYHNFGLKSNGTLWGWGSGSLAGQLGDGTESDHFSPIQLGTATNWIDVICGAYYTLAIKSDGTLWGTGDNTTGQLGIGTTALYSATLTQIGTASNWQQLATGANFTLGLKTNGTIWGWGQNDTFQMGDGSCCSNRLSPGQIGTATDWAMIGASGTRTGLAIKTNGTLWGWGLNSGLIGPSNVNSRQVPTQLNADTDWEFISIGLGHALALKSNGTLWAWGHGGQGQTGDNLSPSYFRDTPIQIGTDTWLKVAAGFNSSYGIKTDGTLWAWGANEASQLGDGTTINKLQPTQIGSDTDWVAVSAGYQHAVALKSNGALWAWGKNDYGQLGNGTTTATTAPVYVTVTGCTLDVPEFEKGLMTLTPNPAQSEISLTYQGREVVDGVIIYDMTGREVYSSHPIASTMLQVTLPISHLQRGTYLLSLLSGGKSVVSRKFVKE